MFAAFLRNYYFVHAILLLTACFFVPLTATAAEPKVWIRVDSRRCDFLVFTRPGQTVEGPFASAGDTALTATPGTVISIDNKTAMLHSGSLYLECQKGRAAIATRNAKINVPEGMAIILDYNPASAAVHLAVLAKDPGAKVGFLRRKGKERHNLEGGQEIKFSAQDLPAEPRKFDQSNPDFSAEILSMTPIYSKNELKKTGAPLHVLGAAGTEFRCSAPDTISLRYGQVFAEVDDRLVVKTPVVDAIANKGAIIDVEVNEDSDLSRVKSLSQAGSPVVDFGTQKIKLSTGHEITVSTRNLEDKDLYPADGIGRRRAEVLKLEDKRKASSCDFSIISFLNQCSHVDGIKRASSSDMKELRDEILKTASAVQIVTTRYGNYRASVKTPRKPKTRQQNPAS